MDTIFCEAFDTDFADFVSALAEIAGFDAMMAEVEAERQMVDPTVRFGKEA